MSQVNVAREDVGSKMPYWRRLRGAVRAAITVDRATGGASPRAVGRAFAAELSFLTGALRSRGVALLRFRALALLASLNSKGHLNANAPAAREMWEEMDAMTALTAQRRRVVPFRARREARREALPVERAREASLVTLMQASGIKLVGRGPQYRAKCPLCHSSRLAFSVDAKRGLWHCFKCGEGGDGIAFIKRVRGVSFADAVRELAG